MWVVFLVITCTRYTKVSSLSRTNILLYYRQVESGKFQKALPTVYSEQTSQSDKFHSHRREKWYFK